MLVNHCGFTIIELADWSVDKSLIRKLKSCENIWILVIKIRETTIFGMQYEQDHPDAFMILILLSIFIILP